MQEVILYSPANYEQRDASGAGASVGYHSRFAKVFELIDTLVGLIERNQVSLYHDVQRRTTAEKRVAVWNPWKVRNIRLVGKNRPQRGVDAQDKPDSLLVDVQTKGGACFLFGAAEGRTRNSQDLTGVPRRRLPAADYPKSSLESYRSLLLG